MNNEYISKDIANTVKMIAAVHSDVVFCGSFGLVYNGLLQRQVKDLDIITEKDYFRKDAVEFFFHDRIKKNSTSEKFLVGDTLIKAFCLMLNNTKVDVFYTGKKISNYEVVDFDGVKIKVESPEKAIEAKKNYVLTDKYQINILKHLKDLILLGVDRKELVNIINKSHLYSNKLPFEEKDRHGCSLPQHDFTTSLPKHGDDLPF